MEHKILKYDKNLVPFEKDFDLRASRLEAKTKELLKNHNAANGLLGDFYAKSYDLEEMYPHTHPASGYYLHGIDFGEKARG